MGYFVETNLIKGTIEEKIVNGVATNYSIYINFSNTAGVRETDEQGSFSLNNKNDSQARSFSIVKKTTCVNDIDPTVNPTSDTQPYTKVIKLRGVGSLPQKYRAFYDSLKGRGHSYNGVVYKYDADVSYTEVDPLVKTDSLIFNLLELFPTELEPLQSRSRCSESPSAFASSDSSDVSGCCFGELSIDGSFDWMDLDALGFNRIRIYGSVTRTLKTYCKVPWRLDSDPIVNFDGSPYKNLKCKGKTKIGTLKYITCDDFVLDNNNREQRITVINGSGLPDGAFKKGAEKGTITIRTKQFVKLGCCAPDCGAISKIKVDPIYKYLVEIAKTNSWPQLAVTTLLAKFGVDSDDPRPVFRNCECPSLLTGTTITGLS